MTGRWFWLRTMDEINIASGEDFAIGVLLPGSFGGGVNILAREVCQGYFKAFFEWFGDSFLPDFFPLSGRKNSMEMGRFWPVFARFSTI